MPAIHVFPAEDVDARHKAGHDESCMLSRYVAAMDALHHACLVIASTSLVVITIIIPWGVFTRYVLNSASSWPEPTAVILMIVLSFFAAVVCYREHLHIGVGLLSNLLSGPRRLALGIVIELCMLGTNLFMLWYGITLVQATWYQGLAEFPQLSVGLTYLPIPVGAAVTVLFIVERALTGNFFPPPLPPAEAISTE